ncbi:uncharacterized protein LOC109540953 [Dendroctonus ponderosae]|uniref:uncharacterized protein LOC109540953 n=1 Tax=Dendroctonus ponderosae TaxID=77166 RepID=UPI0020357A2C|nr:uncharacterized protein LOC109540953 [Dendroctonus ponderosae]KAH1029964.1 hypothetical protein HUJ05_003109 [Dendroctonus ponderosae]
MGSEKEKMDRVVDVLRFIDLMVRQMCRRAHYDHLTRTKASKEDKDSIYSIDHLKKVYDKPRESIYHLIKNPQRTLKGLRVENPGPLPKKDSNFTKIEQKMLLDFVKKVQEQAPKVHFVWVDLQHYLFYAYRNFACQVPKITSDTLSTYFVCEMRELINCLREDDESQVWLRIFTLLREYCIFAQWHYSQNDKEEPLKKFFDYYEAMLTAAKTLIPVFTDFERDIIYKKYRVCWIDFNTFIFIRFFYESDRVKTKVDECLKTKKSVGDTPQTFVSMTKLKRTWSEHENRITVTNQQRKLADNSQEGIREKRILAAHKKLLSATFWVDRNNDVKKIVDLDRIDDNLFDLLKDRQFFPEGPGLNKNGQCICEECLVAKYKIYLDSNEDFSFIATEERTTYCRRCKCILNLEQFQDHVNDHLEDLSAVEKEVLKPSSVCRVISEKNDLKMNDNSILLSEMLSEKLKISNGDFVNTTDTGKLKNNDSLCSKTAFEKFIQSRKEKIIDKVKNGRIPSLRDELLANGFGKSLKDEADKPTSPSITAEKLAETEELLRQIRINGHRPGKRNASEPAGNKGAAPTVCPTAPEIVEPQKKCSCTYCEVFGIQKVVEPREKLRVRLFRRKEKKRESEINQKSFDRENSKFKLETRVPMPPSPSNFPASPPDLDPVSVGKMNEIRGLVNYIEGNPAKSKADLAQKKAAKKARQREKKEQEKLQVELEKKRKLEEMARQEHERKMELKREKERLEEQKKLEEAQLKKKLKKQRQAKKRESLVLQKTTIEETIPAMVTIKRVPGGMNGTPLVTITLKGCTPDQDKLLTTLVEEPVIDEYCKTAKMENKIVDVKGNKKKKNGIHSSNKNVEVPNEAKIIAKDVKVTLAVDKTSISSLPNGFEDIEVKRPKPRATKREREPTDDEIRSLGNLRLPPGITITKVEGPVANKSYHIPIANQIADSNKDSSVLGKSGVIVVDTEKLIQKTKNDDSSKVSKTSKKKKKKNKKTDVQPNESKEKPRMVTLRNPMFQQFQSQHLMKNTISVDESAPAAIFKTENGMVTIRSSRLQQSLECNMDRIVNSKPLEMPFIPNMTNFINSNNFNTTGEISVADNVKDEATVTPLDAQEILSGLPGIQITKIDKNDGNFDDNMDIDTSHHDAQVSIIPSNGNDFDLEFDKDDDWLYDNVFKPRDVLEDDMDDEELELEAFKRFCHQSVPPKEKKVAHFNVADIVLKKKLA